MKIRNGFVSNSSSSSFIISDEKFPTVKSLAIYMIKRKMKDSDSDESEYSSYDKKYIERLNNLDENQTVSFPSCNYDTYIRKVGDCYLVATCNNTDWNLYQYNTRLTDKAKEELKELKKKYPKGGGGTRKKIKYLLEDDTEEFSRFGKDFYALDSEVVGIETYDYCPKCADIYSRMWQTLKYGKICLKCNPYFQRLDKLNKINKISDD